MNRPAVPDATAAPLYDTIGEDYARFRSADERIARRIREALAHSRTVVNVGAGAGAYEPRDTHVIAIEPSAVMARQRPAGAAPPILAAAERLPLIDGCVDAAMSVLSIHHWTEPEAGIREMRRVARERIVLLTIDPHAEAEMWLLADYLPEVAEADLGRFPSMEQLRAWLGSATTISPVDVPDDCSDGFLLSFWNRPEALLNPQARAATSAFATLDDDLERAVVDRLEADLRSGAWDRKYGHLRSQNSFDAGLRLVTTELAEP